MKFSVIILIGLFAGIGCNRRESNSDVKEIVEVTSGEQIDLSKLTAEDSSYLKQCKDRRILFDEYLQSNSIKLQTCPGCGYPTLEARGQYDICAVCNWEDDGQDDKQANEILGGPNRLSLTENRVNIERKLSEAAKRLNGQVNTIPKEVLDILQNHKLRMEKIANSIPMEADTSHQGWKEWEIAEQQLLVELIKK